MILTSVQGKEECQYKRSSGTNTELAATSCTKDYHSSSSYTCLFFSVMFALMPVDSASVTIRNIGDSDQVLEGFIHAIGLQNGRVGDVVK